MLSKKPFAIFWPYLTKLIYPDPLKPLTKYAHIELCGWATKTSIVLNLFLNTNYGLPPELN